MKEIIEVVYIPDGFKPKGPHADRLALLADELMFRTHKNEWYRNGGFINFDRKAWLRIRSGTYGEIKRAAIDQELIESNEKYSSNWKKNSKKKSFPKSVRLTKELRNANSIEFKLQKPIKRKGNHKVLNLRNDDEVGLWLCKNFEEVELPSDHVINQILERIVEVKSKHHCIRSVQKIKACNFFASRCDYGRFHSNFTQLHKGVRKKLRYGTEKLIGVDVKNCQPALLPFVLANNDTSQDTLKMNQFIDKTGTSTGQFYEKMMESTGKTSLTRDEIKKLYFQSIYGSIKKTKESDVFKMLKKISPEYMEILLRIKKDDYRELARQLQRKESKIIIDTCCASLMRNYPHLPIITIHDEIMTTEECREIVRMEMMKSFKQITKGEITVG